MSDGDSFGIRRHLPMAFVADLDAPLLDPNDARHLTKALRLSDGDHFGVSDGVGGWREVCFVRRGDEFEVEVVGSVSSEAAPAERITIGFTPVKGERPEWFVQKLTELGVDRIIPLVTERSVVRWDATKQAKLAARFETTAREAAMQCRRLWLPAVEKPTPIADVRTEFAVADPAGRSVESGDRSLLVGPEGGWSASEIEGADLVALPGAVLRAETAAIAAASMLGAARLGWMAGEA